MAYDEGLGARMRAAFDGRADLVEKRMFGGVAFLVRGRMACGIVGSTLMLRLSPDEAERHLAKPHVRRMDFTGRPMRGFLYVDPPAIRTDRGLRGWMARAIAYAEAQPAKRRRVRSARRRGPARPSRSS